MISEPITISLDKERTLRVDFAALRRIENLTGHSFLRGTPGRVPVDSLEFLLVSLWAALVADDPDLTLSQVEAMISIENLVEVEAKVAGAIRGALGKAQSQATAAATEESPSTG